MSDTPAESFSPPLRIVGLKVVTIIAALCVLLVFLILISLFHGMHMMPWVTRGTVVAVVLGYVAYTYHMVNPRLPLITPEDEDPMSVRVYQSVARVSEKAHISMPRVVIDPSDDVNAVTFGFSPKSAYIVVHEGLLRQMERDDELDAVIAHEVSHIKNRDCAAATAFNLVAMLAQAVAVISRFVLSFGAASSGVVAEIAGCFGALGFMGAIIGLMILIGFLVFMFYTAVAFGVALLLLGITILAINAFERQRERLADDFAGQLVGTKAVARVMVKLAESDPTERQMVCHLIGMDPKAETPMPMDQIIETARTTQISVGVGTRLMEWLSSHPLTVLRIQRVLRQSQRKGLFESVLSPLANALESAAVWLTPETRAAARGPSEREGPTLLIGCAVGTVTALLAAALPGMSSTIAIIAIGVPSGLLVGFGTTMVLSRNGPFLGADAIDAGLTGSLGWFVAAVAVAGGLVLPNGVATLVSGWVVLLVAVATSAVGYVFLRPATADLTTAGVLRETPSPVQEESVFVAKVIALSGADSGVPPSTETVPEPSDQQAKKVEPVRKAALVKPKRPPLKHSAIWFVPGEDDEPAGPFSAERLLEMWRLGELTDDSLCWREGMEDWRPLGQTEPFRGAIGAARHSPRLIRFKCSHCNSLIVMAKSHAGRRAKCKNCGHEVAVPEK